MFYTKVVGFKKNLFTDLISLTLSDVAKVRTRLSWIFKIF